MITSILAPNPGPYTLDGTRTWLIASEAILDPGPLIDSHIDAVVTAIPSARYIFVTHRHADHAPAALEVRRRTGATLVAPAGVFERCDHVLSDGDRLDLQGMSLEAIATPGHTGEHFCFLSSEGDLFTGDTILGTGTTTIFPPDGHMGDYLSSLRRLRAREPKRIYPGHGPVSEDAIGLIDSYIDHRLEREEQILGAVNSETATIGALRRAIYRDLDPRLHQAAELQIQAHLTHLEEKGLVTQSGNGFIVASRSG